MKKIWFFLLVSTCILDISGCGSRPDLSDTSPSASEPIQTTEVRSLSERKTWSKQELAALFSGAKETEWEYIDCAVFSDYACNRIGAVLFEDKNRGTSNVAFFDSDGFFHQSGTYAKTAEEPDFTYLGDGTVTFKLEAEDGTIYHYTLTIFIDGVYVSFKAEDDLHKVKMEE